MNPYTHDLGAFIQGYNALTARLVLSSAEGEVNGTAIDRFNFVELPRSCKVVIPWDVSLTSASQMVLTLTVQHSTGSTSGWADYNGITGSTANGQVAVTIGTTASTATQALGGQLQADVDLGAANRYIRVQLLTAFDTATADDIDYAGVVVMGGSDLLPAGSTSFQA